METQQDIQIISPTRETIELSGNLSYGEGQRAWNTLRLKKAILHEFPKLKKRREKFAYKLFLCPKFKELRKK